MASPVNVKEVCREIADQMGVPEEEVRQAVRSQFQFVHDTMKSGSFKGVRLQGFGLFHVVKGRIDHLNTRKKKSHERNLRGNPPTSDPA